MYDPFEQFDRELDRLLDNGKPNFGKFDYDGIPGNRICASKAKAKYGLTDKDLKSLTFKTAPNPMYPRKKVHCYLKKECQALAKAKASRKAHQEDHAEEIMEEKAEAALKRKLAAAELAERFEKKAKTAADRRAVRHGSDSVKLPDSCLGIIMIHLASSLEPAGVRGPSIVAADLANASLVCWDFNAAAKTGVAALADQVIKLEQALPSPETLNDTKHSAASKAKLKTLIALGRLPSPTAAPKLSWPHWDRLLTQPTSFKVNELKEAVKQLGAPMSGTKAELILRLLGLFGLQAPLPSAPPRISALLAALQLERSPVRTHIAWDGPSSGFQLRSDVEALARSGVEAARRAEAFFVTRSGVLAAGKEGGLAAARRELVSAGFTTAAELAAAVKEVQEAELERLAAQVQELRRQNCVDHSLESQQSQLPANRLPRVCWAQRLIEGALMEGRARQLQQPGAHGLVCGCGNAAAKACVRGCCAKCCRLQATGAPASAQACLRHT